MLFFKGLLLYFKQTLNTLREMKKEHCQVFWAPRRDVLLVLHLRYRGWLLFNTSVSEMSIFFFLIVEVLSTLVRLWSPILPEQSWERRKEASATQKRIKWTEQAGNCGHQLLSSCLKGEPTDWSRSLQFYSHYLQSLHCATSYKCKASYCMLLALHNPSRRNRLLLVKPLPLTHATSCRTKPLLEDAVIFENYL